MALVINWTTGETREVKNLGWLLAHWRQVDALTVLKQKDGGAILVAELNVEERTDFAKTCAPTWVKPRLLYVIEWASYDICLGWLNRPSFEGIDVIDVAI